MSEATTALGVIDIQKIMASIPHRYPFLLVDRVVEIDGDTSGVGIKNVTVNEPQFTGHFPERPVFPGVLMIEAMAQTAGVLVVSSRGDDEAAVSTVLFTSMVSNLGCLPPLGCGGNVHVFSSLTFCAARRAVPSLSAPC